ncbi:MAG: phospholipase D family protein [Limnohabitans sp.]|nr:phospholipase D family protein [Limnohabitans sp.]
MVASFNSTDHSPVASARGSRSENLSSPSQVEVIGTYFNPPDNTAQAVADTIDLSKKEVRVQAYGFTHNGIAQALVRAHQRGVDVKVLLDKKSQTTNQYVVNLLIGSQIQYRLDGKHAIAHNKVIIVDSDIVITGSFNFTNSAQMRNAENLLILRSNSLAENYRANWMTHWDHSN